jgi:hypothetical protein
VPKTASVVRFEKFGEPLRFYRLECPHCEFPSKSDRTIRGFTDHLALKHNCRMGNTLEQLFEYAGTLITDATQGWCDRHMEKFRKLKEAASNGPGPSKNAKGDGANEEAVSNDADKRPAKRNRRTFEAEDEAEADDTADKEFSFPNIPQEDTDGGKPRPKLPDDNKPPTAFSRRAGRRRRPVW